MRGLLQAAQNISFKEAPALRQTPNQLLAYTAEATSETEAMAVEETAGGTQDTKLRRHALCCGLAPPSSVCCLPNAHSGLTR